jgi:hypothetical protein
MNYERDSARIDSKFSRYLDLTFSRCFQVSNCADILGRQLRHIILFSAHWVRLHQAERPPVLHIFLARYPFEVRRSIASLYRVFVVHLGEMPRIWYKRTCNQSVH